MSRLFTGQVALLLALVGIATCNDAKDGQLPRDASVEPPARVYLHAAAGGRIHTLLADPQRGGLTWQGSTPAGDDARLVEVVAGTLAQVYVHTQIGQAQAILRFEADPAGSLVAKEELRLPYPLVQGVTQISRHPKAPWFVLSATNEAPGLEDQLLPVANDGRLGAHRSISQLFYAFAWDPAGQHFYGLDGEEIFQYAFDAAAGTITPHDPPRAVGSAGRTVLGLYNHPNGRWIYGVEEGALGLYLLDARGTLTGDAFVSNPAPSQPTYWTALRLHPEGRFLYALGYLTGTREAIVDLYAIDPDGGRLTFIRRERGPGRHRIINHGLQAPLLVGHFLILGGASTAPDVAGTPVLVVYRVGDDGGLTAEGEPVALTDAGRGGVSFVFAVDQALGAKP